MTDKMLFEQSQKLLEKSFCELNRSLEISSKTIAALNIAVHAIAQMGEWGDPYSTEAANALSKITEKLSSVIKR